MLRASQRREKLMTANKCTALLVLFVSLFGSPGVGAALASQSISSDKQARHDVSGFTEFFNRVQDYVKLHNDGEATLPSLKPTDQPGVISAHQNALAKKIREARPHAKPGDILTHDAREAFEHAFRSAFQGPKAANARATIEQGAPLKEVHLVVNAPYPDGVPHTTVPPTLLQELPKLPNQVVYRVVGRDLVLLDERANLVVDLMHEIFPRESKAK
jgi:hypothetical protein